MDDGKAHAAALAGLLGREEAVEDPVEDLGRDAVSPIPNGEACVLAGVQIPDNLLATEQMQIGGHKVTYPIPHCR